jgi:hypothetical protein
MPPSEDIRFDIYKTTFHGGKLDNKLTVGGYMDWEMAVNAVNYMNSFINEMIKGKSEYALFTLRKCHHNPEGYEYVKEHHPEFEKSKLSRLAWF